MKRLLILLGLLPLAFVQAQNLPTTTLDPSVYENSEKINVPFSAIQVLDVRFDQSNIGSLSRVVAANSRRFRHQQTIGAFPDSLHRFLPTLLQRLLHLQADSKDTLVLLVKQFRVSDRLTNPINLRFEPLFFLRLSYSAFRLRHGALTKLFSVDDHFSKKIPNDHIPKEELMDIYRQQNLMALLQKGVENKNWQAGGSSFRMETVQAGIRQRFQLPLLTDSVRKQGVYRSFQEFKQNAPSLTQVAFERKKGKVVGIKDANGQEMSLSQFWGVSDGRKLYVIFRGELCELLPSGNSFCFGSYTRRSDLAGLPNFGDYAPQTGILGAVFIKADENRTQRQYFYLNLDDESIYLEELFGTSTLKHLEKELLR